MLFLQKRTEEDKQLQGSLLNYSLLHFLLRDQWYPNRCENHNLLFLFNLLPHSNRSNNKHSPDSGDEIAPFGVSRENLPPTLVLLEIVLKHKIQSFTTHLCFSPTDELVTGTAIFCYTNTAKPRSLSPSLGSHSCGQRIREQHPALGTTQEQSTSIVTKRRCHSSHAPNTLERLHA